MVVCISHRKLKKWQFCCCFLDSFPLRAQKIMKPCCFTYLESILHGEPLPVINRVMVITYYNYAKIEVRKIPVIYPLISRCLQGPYNSIYIDRSRLILQWYLKDFNRFNNWYTKMVHQAPRIYMKDGPYFNVSLVKFILV